MHVTANNGALVVRFGRRFAAPDAERVSETLRAFSPISELALDFSEVHRFEHTAIVPLANAVHELPHLEVRLLGVTRLQARMLQHFGLHDRARQDRA